MLQLSGTIRNTEILTVNKEIAHLYLLHPFLYVIHSRSNELFPHKG